MTTINFELERIQTLVRWANEAGRKGMKIVGWMPPTTASGDPMGVLIYEIGDRND
jgi:hypothetical protein